MRKFVVLISVTLFLSLLIKAQTPDFQTIKTEKGMMILNGNPAQAFTLLIAGDNPRGSQNEDGGLLINTEGNSVLVYFIKTKDFLGAKKLTDEKEILDTHRDWDINAQETSGKVKINAEKGVTLLAVNDLPERIVPKKIITSVYWNYTSPTSGNVVYYQTVLLGDLVLMIGTVASPKTPPAKVREIVRPIFESITLLPAQKSVPAKKPTIKPKKKKV